MTRAPSREERIKNALGLTDEQVARLVDELENTAEDVEPWVPELATFGARLAAIRHRMKWYNIDQAAREYGMSKESLRAYEKDLYLPKGQKMIEVCQKVSRRTGVDFGWLYGGESMRGKAPSSEALEWLGLDSLNAHYRNRAEQLTPGTVSVISTNNGEHVVNTGWLPAAERPVERSRPKDRRPTGRAHDPNDKDVSRPVSPTPVRPTRLPRPNGR